MLAVLSGSVVLFARSLRLVPVESIRRQGQLTLDIQDVFTWIVWL